MVDASAAGTIASVLVLGAGYTGATVARLSASQGLSVRVTVRSPERAERLSAQGFDVIRADSLDAWVSAHVDGDTHVVVTFPPDGATDARVAPALAFAARVTYVSSTGVYGELTGRIDDTTIPPSPPTARARRLLDAEAAYRAVGATVLRSPAIYGPERGLHVRVRRGDHLIPGDGSRTLSRIHVEDLAALVLAAAAVRGETFVVGDAEPARHADVVRWVCEEYGVPLPGSAPLGSVHDSLRADRAVDGSRALRVLGVSLRYPTFREGMARDRAR